MIRTYRTADQHLTTPDMQSDFSLMALGNEVEDYLALQRMW